MKKSGLMLITLAGLIAGPAQSAEQDFVGSWMIELTQRNRIQNGLLEIESGDDGLVAYVEGGPIRIYLDGDRIEMGIDDWTGGSMPFERYFRGSLEDGVMSGSFAPEHPITDREKAVCEKIPLGCPHPTGTWKAERYTAIDTSDLPPNPVDISGRWSQAAGGMRRWTVDMTDAAIEWNEGFNVEFDLPRQRCVSNGLANGMSTPEIFQSDKKLTFVLGFGVRRIYLDGRKPPEYTEWFPLGISSGHWEGSTLSENARIIERYSLDDEGILHGVMWLHDPENYRRPPIRRNSWRKDPDETVAMPQLCDPDSFYRQIYDQGQFEEYIDRSDRRY
jgi:hypothetical protein